MIIHQIEIDIFFPGGRILTQSFIRHEKSADKIEGEIKQALR